MKFKFYLFCKYFFSNSKGCFRKTFLFQAIGLFIGSLLIALTYGIMDGMEDEISKKISTFNYKYHKNQMDINYSFDYLNSGKEEVAELNFNDYTSIVNVRSFNLFKEFLSKINNDMDFELLTSEDFRCKNINDNCHISRIEYLNALSDESFIIIGENLSKDANIKIGDIIKLSDILDINIVSGSYLSDSFLVTGIYSFNFLNYDYNNVYIEEKGMFFKNAKLSYFFDNIDQFQGSVDGSVNSNKSFSSLLSAITLEKYIYVSLGIFILLIASIMIFNNTTVLLLEKRNQFKLLYSQGLSREIIFYSSILTSVLLSVIISSLGYCTSLIFYYLNEKINLMKHLFIYSPFDKIPIIISMDKYILNISLVIILTFIATLFSLYIIDKNNERI